MPVDAHRASSSSVRRSMTVRRPRSVTRCASRSDASCSVAERTSALEPTRLELAPAHADLDDLKRGFRR